ncbi:P-loop containing nucleoside triphosphate hydrolase protein [Pleurotus eryngii]|uniref:RNA helicase n=1 Tax=Pleurotus eryngii TaxID=5323 RepID=A0A9P6DCJ7_PLEER|nr:P-loop containing nucleoside triphosphate hydrolase protein [Pleurotus eryngii]
MAKKKKTQLKPVSRGFATTSVAKKVEPVEEEIQPEKTPADPEPQLGPADAGAGLQVNSNASGAEDAKTIALQAIVDSNQEKVTKEINRTINLIEQDRRFTQTLPELELDRRFVDYIAQLAIEYKILENKWTLDVPRDKALTRLGITYGVLRRLGFSESRVEECLRSIAGIGLEEAYDWLYLHCSEQELSGTSYDKESSDGRLTSAPQTPSSWTSQTPSTPRTPSSAQLLLPQTSTIPMSPLNPNAPVFTPSFPVSPPPKDLGRTSDIIDVEDPNSEHAKIRIQLFELERLKSGKDASLTNELQNKLKKLSQHYFFDARDAEALYHVERENISASALRARLQGLAEVPSLPPLVDRPPAKVATPQPSTQPERDIFDDADEVGLLEILDEMPATATDSEGTTVKIYDIRFPKHWSGRTPEKLLAEKVSKLDKYAVVSYSDLAGVSRAKRASVKVRWVGQTVDEWSMVDVACYDDVQARHYVATMALHAISHPSKEGGFVVDNVTAASVSFVRSFPACLRDLWDELEEARKAAANLHNRNVWDMLQSVLDTKINSNELDEKENRRDLGAGATIPSRVKLCRDVQDTFSEQLMLEFQARQASSAYQIMLEQRNTLPIAAYRQHIIEALDSSQVLVLSGETGCGKSTQVPAFLLEDQLSQGKPCRIFCTEPRRISAISLAHRVSQELGDPPNAVGTLASLIGYSIRLESNTTRNTRLAFVTNGIALRMLEDGSGSGGQGTAFDDITHIVVDEVHERTIESDFLLIVLKSLIQQRPSLKVILMSATMEADKVSAYFDGCPVIQVPGRTYPVEVRYLEDAVEWTKWHITEDSPYARRLNDNFYKGKARADWSEDITEGIDNDSDDPDNEKVQLGKRYSAKTTKTINLFDERTIPYDLIIRLLEQMCTDGEEYSRYSAAVLIFMPGLREIRRMNDLLMEHQHFGSSSFCVYPLHSTLSSENQSAVFDIPPPSIRKIVIATNIAETGITIPDITCVIDSGKHREMRFDEKRQISRLIETFIARSNAAQRRGRAGRVQDGLCFHLFTKSRHDTKLAPQPLPEMMRLSLSDLALRIKIMKLQLGKSIDDVLSRAIDPPVAINVQRAISSLVEVKALTPQEDITPMGVLLSKLPTDVHLGKFLLVATVFRCLDPALTIAAALNSKSPFVTPFGLEQEADRAKHSFRTENSDFMTVHNAFASWRRASDNGSFVRNFCKRNYLSQQNLQQIEELRQQFLGYLVDSRFIQVDASFVRELNRARYSRGRTRFVMVPHDLDSNSSNVDLLNAALVAGLYPKILSVDSQTGQMRTILNNQQASFHPSSINFGRKPADFGVNHLAYFTLMRSKKLYAWETSPVNDIAMVLLCGEMETKLVADSVFIDRKLRYKVSPKVNIALKLLRAQLANLLAKQYRGKVLTESLMLWYDIALMILGRVNPNQEERSIQVAG